MTRSRPKLFPCFLLALALSGHLQAAGKMSHQRTAHYEIDCDVSAAFTKEVAQHMEAIFTEYLKRLQGFEGKISGRFSVKVFRNKEDYLSLVGEKMGNSAGVYMPGKHLLAAYLGSFQEEQVLRTLYHEGFHQFTDAYLGDLGLMPPWISEGLAELFGDATWNKKRFEIGEVPTEKIFALKGSRKAGNWFSLEDLVSMNQKEWSDNLARSLEMGRAQYMEAWAVVHFLVYAEKGKYRKALIAYIKSMAARENPITAFRNAFGNNLKAFESRWEQYLETLEPSPKFQCRRNLTLLALFIPPVAESESASQDITHFHNAVRAAFQAGAQVTAYGEETITGSQMDRVEALFRCPVNKKADRAESYEISIEGKPKDGKERIQSTAIRCPNHPGIILAARCVPDEETGRYLPVVEENIATKSATKPASQSRTGQ